MHEGKGVFKFKRDLKALLPFFMQKKCRKRSIEVQARKWKIMTKYIFVTGGVVSGLGKGITAASLGRLLKARGLKVAAQKLDPYINVDPGTMSPYQAR